MFFGKLLLVFTVKYEEKEYGFAYIHKYKTSNRSSSILDRDLGLHRVHAKPTKLWEFIPITSITRGVFLVPDSDKAHNAFVLDVLDTDLYVRLRSIFPEL